MNKIILGEIIGPGSPFQRVRICRPDSPAIGFKIAMVIWALQPVMDSHDEQKNKLLDDFGTPIKGKKRRYHFRESDKPDAKLDQEKWTAFETAYNELLSTETEIQFVKLTLDDLDKANIDPVLTPNEIMGLLWLIDAPELTDQPTKKRARKRKPKSEAETGD